MGLVVVENIDYFGPKQLTIRFMMHIAQMKRRTDHGVSGPPF